MAKVMDFNISNSTMTYNSSTTIDEIQDWNDFTPVVDWESLSENFLIDPKIDENAPSDHFPREETLIEEYTMFDDQDHEDLKGLKLIHLLTAAAEALAGPDKSRELAKVILVRLSELVSPHEGSTNMERLAAHFTDALQRLLDGPSCNNPRAKKARCKEEGRRQSDDALAAFQLLQDGSPYITFGHFTANQSILEAVASDRRVHIVDFDIMEGTQWASLMQALVSRREGPSGPHLRITALSRSGKNGLRPLGYCSVQETGRRLTAFAASVGQPFSFHQCRLDHDERFRPATLKLVKGEALIVNCMLDLPHLSFRARDSIASFLSGTRALKPRLVALVEEETGPVGTGGPFAGQFMDALHRYSTVYDSLEAGFPMHGQARSLVERVFLGPRIVESLGMIYRAHGPGEECSWARWMDSAGFRPVEMSYANRCQAKLLLGLYNDGYKVEELCGNKLVLGWKSRRLLSASLWASQDNDL